MMTENREHPSSADTNAAPVPYHVSILLAESGTDWAKWKKSWAGPIVKLVQAEEEGPAEFAQRVARRIERLGREHAVLQRLALIVQDEFTPAMRSARSDIMSMVALHLVRSPTPLTVHFAGLDADGLDEH
jgi:hypothetical protein